MFSCYLSFHSERGKFYCGGEIKGLNVPTREFPCKSPLEVRELLPSGNVTVICTYIHTWTHTHTHMDTFIRSHTHTHTVSQLVIRF